MIEVRKAGKVILTIDDLNRLHWEDKDNAPAELVRRSEQSTLPLVGGGRRDDEYVTEIEQAKRGSDEWVQALLDAVWVFDVEAVPVFSAIR